MLSPNSSVSRDKIFICGAYSERKACFTMSETVFQKIPDTRFGHTLSAMVNYKGYPIVIGGQDIYDPYTNKVEYFEGEHIYLCKYA